MFKSLLKTLANSPATDFGTALANRLATQYPVSLDKPDAKKISADRMSKILEGLYHDAKTFRHTQKLGYLGRTRLGHAFKWRLIELGYSAAFIDMATEGLVVYMHQRNTSSK